MIVAYLILRRSDLQQIARFHYGSDSFVAGFFTHFCSGC
jgi:hypothetical protein